MFDEFNNNIYTVLIINNNNNNKNKNDKLWQYDKVPPYFEEVGRKWTFIFVMCIYEYKNT